MISISRTFLAAIVGVAPFVGLPLLGGCSGHIAAYPEGETYVYTPGYYYDRDYYDNDHHFHARHYYYYDGNRWQDRDGVPSGFTARERHEARERHDMHQQHRDHDRDHDRD
jgi:hypothetical protein